MATPALSKHEGASFYEIIKPNFAAWLVFTAGVWGNTGHLTRRRGCSLTPPQGCHIQCLSVCHLTRPALAHSCGFRSALSCKISELQVWTPPYSLCSHFKPAHRFPSETAFFLGSSLALLPPCSLHLPPSQSLPCSHPQKVPSMHTWAESGPGGGSIHLTWNPHQDPLGPCSHLSQPYKLCTKWYVSSHTQVNFHQTFVWVSSRAFPRGTHWLLELGHG